MRGHHGEGRKTGGGRPQLNDLLDRRGKGNRDNGKIGWETKGVWGEGEMQEEAKCGRLPRRDTLRVM